MKKRLADKLIPKIRKDISSFLFEEKGDISKQVLISFGAILAGLEALNLVTKVASGQSISAKHQHCDPAHYSGGGWHGSVHTNSAYSCTPVHYSSGGWGYSINPGHTNNISLTYG